MNMINEFYQYFKEYASISQEDTVLMDVSKLVGSRCIITLEYKEFERSSIIHRNETITITNCIASNSVEYTRIIYGDPNQGQQYITHKRDFVVQKEEHGNYEDQLFHLSTTCDILPFCDPEALSILDNKRDFKFRISNLYSALKHYDDVKRKILGQLSLCKRHYRLL